MMKSVSLDQREARAMASGMLSTLIRPITPMPHPSCAPDGCGWHWHPENSDDHYVFAPDLLDLMRSIVDYCPLGNSGDVLLCKEDYVTGHETDDSGYLITTEDQGNDLKESVWYRAAPDVLDWWDDGERTEILWMDAATMPAALVRHRPIIARVRVVSPCELTRDEAMACGVERVDPYDDQPDLPPGMPACWRNYSDQGGWFAGDPMSSLRSAVISQYGKEAWVNPAWIITLSGPRQMKTKS